MRWSHAGPANALFWLSLGFLGAACWTLVIWSLPTYVGLVLCLFSSYALVAGVRSSVAAFRRRRRMLDWPRARIVRKS